MATKIELDGLPAVTSELVYTPRYHTSSPDVIVDIEREGLPGAALARYLEAHPQINGVVCIGEPPFRYTIARSVMWGERTNVTVSEHGTWHIIAISEMNAFATCVEHTEDCETAVKYVACIHPSLETFIREAERRLPSR